MAPYHNTPSQNFNKTSSETMANTTMDIVLEQGFDVRDRAEKTSALFNKKLKSVMRPETIQEVEAVTTPSANYNINNFSPLFYQLNEIFNNISKSLDKLEYICTRLDLTEGE